MALLAIKDLWNLNKGEDEDESKNLTTLLARHFNNHVTIHIDENRK
jgi:hypothetical protein